MDDSEPYVCLAFPSGNLCRFDLMCSTERQRACVLIIEVGHDAFCCHSRSSISQGSSSALEDDVGPRIEINFCSTRLNFSALAGISERGNFFWEYRRSFPNRWQVTESLTTSLSSSIVRSQSMLRKASVVQLCLEKMSSVCKAFLARRKTLLKMSRGVFADSFVWPCALPFGSNAISSGFC